MSGTRPAAEPTQRLTVHVAAQSRPLTPCAVLAIGDPLRCTLLDRLLRMDGAQLARIEGLCAKRSLLLLAAAADLPWVDGVQYLGLDPEAASLLVPTASRANVAGALLERAVLHHAARCGGSAPVQRWAVSWSPPLLVPAASTRRLKPETLRLWRRALSEHAP